MAGTINTEEYKVLGTTSGSISVKAGASPTAHDLVLPATQGAANEVMVNDGSGNLSNSFHYPEKQYLGDGTDFTVTGTNWTTTRAVAVPYQTSDGAWRMRINIEGNVLPSAINLTLTLSDVTFKTGYLQAIAALANTTGFNHGRVNGGASTITLNSEIISGTFRVSGDVELESKPDWAD